MQAKTVTDIIYFDFKKAFDSVSHNKLLTKLRAYGISGDLFDWIWPFYLIGSRQLQFVILCRLLSVCTTGLCTWANFVSFVYK